MRVSLFFTFLLLSLAAFSQIAADSVLVVADHMPEYPDGEAGMYKFITSHIKYPKAEADSNIQGRVVLKFIVNKDGSLSDIKVLKGVSKGLDAEALRVVKLIPAFNPGLQDGKLARVYYVLPITFRLIETQPADTATDPNNRKPSFPGGRHALSKFLYQNIIYPENELVNNIQGRVKMAFTVGVDGTISDVHIVDHASPGYDKEAARLISLMPKFEPGLIDGKPTAMTYELPIVFQLTDEMSAQYYVRDSLHPAPAPDHMPEYPGAEGGAMAFLMDHIEYPSQAEYKARTEGVCLVRFTINEDGSVSDIRIIKKVSSNLDEEVKLAVSLLHFKPATLKGKPVKADIQFPVTFKLQDYVMIHWKKVKADNPIVPTKAATKY